LTVRLSPAPGTGFSDAVAVRAAALVVSTAKVSGLVAVIVVGPPLFDDVAKPFTAPIVSGPAFVILTAPEPPALLKPAS
jgi:hypothetical protein